MPPLRDLVESVLSRHQLELEDLSQVRAGSRVIVRVMVDGDGADGRGPNLDEVAQASRAISAELDASDVMGQTSYVLEVSTRGVGRPLTKPAHWRRNHGRLVRLTLRDSQVVTGRIEAVSDQSVRLSPDRDVLFDAVAKAVVEIEMNPLDEEEPWISI
jgi:ribosome maturation factor RimP